MWGGKKISRKVEIKKEEWRLGWLFTEPTRFWRDRGNWKRSEDSKGGVSKKGKD